MLSDVMAMMVYGVTMFFMSGAESAVCPSTTVDLNVISTADVHTLSDELACTGEGSFNITWHANLVIERRIEVSGQKHVIVTGNGFPSLRGAFSEDNDAGIFSVTMGSTLRLSHLALEGVNAANGGAVIVRSSSSLFLVECAFRDNNASIGGETACLPHKRSRWCLVKAPVTNYIGTSRAPQRGNRFGKAVTYVTGTFLVMNYTRKQADSNNTEMAHKTIITMMKHHLSDHRQRCFPCSHESERPCPNTHKCHVLWTINHALASPTEAYLCRRQFVADEPYCGTCKRCTSEIK